MSRHSEFRVVPTPPKAGLAAKRTKPNPQRLSVEHVVYGIGNLLHVRPLDDGSLVAVVEFGGVDRSIRLAPEYFVTPIPEIMVLAPHLAPLKQKVAVKKNKASAAPDEGDQGEPEMCERRAADEDGAEHSSDHELEAA